MRHLQNDEIRSIVGGDLDWSDCQNCVEGEKERHEDEYDDSPLYSADYEPRPVSGIMQNWNNVLKWVNPK